MYHTPAGERILTGAEARLFAESLGMLVDFLSDDDYELGNGPFDGLQRNQKIAVLLTIARALLCKEEPAPRLTATIEAAVAAVFQHVDDMLSMEIEDPQTSRPPTWRQLVLAACRESTDGSDLPSEEDEDLETWRLLIMYLEDRILWDNDWADDSLLDTDPEESRRMRCLLGIDDDDYVSVPAEPGDEEAERMLGESPGCPPCHRSSRRQMLCAQCLRRELVHPGCPQRHHSSDPW